MENALYSVVGDSRSNDEVHNGITTYVSVQQTVAFMIFLGYLNCLESVWFADPASFVRWSRYSSAELNVNLDTAEAQSAIPVETDNQLQQTEPTLQQMSERPFINDENVTAMFLPQRFLMHIDYSELVDRIRAAKYDQRPKPLVNSINRKYLFRGRERYLITKFEMDDGDEYYVLTTCLISDCRGNRCFNENQYYGQTIFLYSPSPSPETENILTIMLIKPLMIGIQNIVNQD